MVPGRRGGLKAERVQGGVDEWNELSFDVAGVEAGVRELKEEHLESALLL